VREGGRKTEIETSSEEGEGEKERGRGIEILYTGR